MSRAIENFYVSGFIGRDANGRDQNRLFAYDIEETSYLEVKTDEGLSFTPYSEVFVRAGQLFVIGRASDAADQSVVGNELYGFDESGDVTLVADVRQGPESSFIQADSGLSIIGYPTQTLATARYDSDQYEVVSFVEDGAITPFASFFPSFETIRNLRSPVEFEGNTVFLASADQNPIVPWSFDYRSDTYSLLITFAQPVSGFGFEHLYVLDDTLYARINTSEWGRELWSLNAQSRWELVSDVSPGIAYGAPSYEFTFNNVHYFTAVNNTFGRELYRLDTGAGLVRITDLEPGRAVGANFTRSFDYDDAVYFYTTGTYPGTRLYRMEADETVTLVTDFVEGLAGSYPALVVDMDTETVITGEAFGGTYGLHFILKDGELSFITLPEGSLSSAEVIEGRVYVNMTNSDGGFSVWLMQFDGAWENLITLEGTEGVQRVIDMSVVSLDPLMQTPADEIALPIHTGDETLIGGEGAEILYGGPGEDTLLVTGAQSTHT